MNTSMTGFRWFSKIFAVLYFGGKQPNSIGGVKVGFAVTNMPVMKKMSISVSARLSFNIEIVKLLPYLSH